MLFLLEQNVTQWGMAEKLALEVASSLASKEAREKPPENATLRLAAPLVYLPKPN